jgi:peroxiredoxin
MRERRNSAPRRDAALGPSTRAVSILLALLALLSSSALSAAAQEKSAPAPWYADGLRKLGFTVYDKPAAARDVSATSLDGRTARLSDLRGKIVLLNFWATWCPPCREEMPALEKLWKGMKDKDFTIMGISGGESMSVVKRFVEIGGYTYPIFADPSSEAASAYGIRFIPTTYVIDKDGAVIAMKSGGAAYGGPDSLSLFSALSAR